MARKLARGTRTTRHRKAAASAAGRKRKGAASEPPAEDRLQALLHEMEKSDSEAEADDFLDTTDDMKDLPAPPPSDDQSDEA